MATYNFLDETGLGQVWAKIKALIVQPDWTENSSTSSAYIQNKPTIPNISLNGATTTTPSFYAPTGAGTSGQVLKSNGSGAPAWAAETDEVMVINITETGSGDDTTYSADKTFAEIYAHLSAGNTAVCKLYGGICQLASYDATSSSFKDTTIYENFIAGIAIEITSYDEIYVWRFSNTIPSASSTDPSADGTAQVGSSTDYARADHVHPQSGVTSFNGSTGAITYSSPVTSITLNGSTTASPSFYAPVSTGTAGYVLKSNGSGAPTWAIGREWAGFSHRTNPAVDAHNAWSMKNVFTLGTTATLRHNLMLEALGGNTGDFIATWTESTGTKDYADSSGQTSVYAMMYKDKWGSRNISTNATTQASIVVDVFPHNDTVYDTNGNTLCTIVAASDSTIMHRSSDYIFIGTVYGSDGKSHIVYRTATTSSTPAINLGENINVLQINGAEWDMTTLRSDYTQKTSQLNTKIIYRVNYYYMAVVQNGVGIAIMKSSDCIDWDLEHHIPDPDAHLEACMCATAYVSNNMPTVFVAVRHNYGDGFITLYGFKGLTTWTEMSKVYIPASTGRPMMVSDSNVKYAFLTFSINGRRNAVVVRIGSNNDGTTAYNLLTTPFNVMSNYPCLTFNNKFILFGGTNGLGSSKNGVSIAPIWTEELTNYDTNMSNLLGVVENGAFIPNYTSSDEGKILTIDSNGNITTTTITDNNTTYGLSIQSNVITLSGSDGNSSTIALPVYNGNVSTVGGG